MAVTITRGTTDPKLDEFVTALETFQADHPGAEISLYRHGKYSVRVRIIDPTFAGRSKTERHRLAWPYVAGLPEETLSDLSSFLLIAPAERTSSFASLDFDDPLPSLL